MNFAEEAQQLGPGPMVSDPAYQQAVAAEKALQREAASVRQTMSTPGWKVINSLIDASLILVTERAFKPAKSMNKATTRLLQAQGAIDFVGKFKAALEAARKEIHE